MEKVRRGLSAGRVQSVAVKIICDREKEIEAFIPKEYWTVDAKLLQQDTGAEVIAKLHSKNKKNRNRSSEKKTKEILAELKNRIMRL